MMRIRMRAWTDLDRLIFGFNQAVGEDRDAT